MIVCLDPGHGGEDPGAIDARGRTEKSFTLAQSLIAASFLHGDAHEAILTRRSDTKLNLPERVARANGMSAQVFISIHWNSASIEEANGTIVMYHASSARGQILASLLLEEVGGLDEEHERWERLWAVPDGVEGSRWERSAPYVIAHTHAPAALLEVEFASNLEEADRLASDAFRLLVGRGIANAVGRFARRS
jgi:N-acetylmuramoyl-L-alanine amidase